MAAKVRRLLLSKHPKLISSTDNKGDNPLHVAARINNSSEFVQVLIECYRQQQTTSPSTSTSEDPPPWKLQNKDGNTPLHLALLYKNEELALLLLSIDPSVYQCCNNEGKSPLVVAVNMASERVLEKMYEYCEQTNFTILGRNDGVFVLHMLLFFPDNVLLSFLSTHTEYIDAVDSKGFNILHHWATLWKIWPLKLLLEEEYYIVRDKIFGELIFKTDKISGDSPLHVAARTSCIEFVEAVIDGYQQSKTSSEVPPWKIQNIYGDTPLHSSLSSKNEEIALFFLTLDCTLCLCYNNKGESPLFVAIQGGCAKVVEKILEAKEHFDFKMLRRKDGSTVFHFLRSCPDNILLSLFSTHPEYIDQVDGKGYNILHHWAAKTNCIEYVKALIDGYQQLTTSSEISPWKFQNKYGDTPLHLSLLSKNEEAALYFLSLERTLCESYNNEGESPLFVAVRKGCAKVVQKILEANEHLDFKLLRRKDGSTVFHFLRSCPEGIAKRLISEFGWMINLRDDKGNTALDEAKQANVEWLINFFINLPKEPFNWVSACERGDKSAFLVFIESCHNIPEFFRGQNDTPLHHITLQSYEDYLDFLRIPFLVEFKNTLDSEGATPLHRALEKKKILLAKALLIDNGVRRNIEDYHGLTAMDMLSKLCKEDENWAWMCKQIKVKTYLKTTYIQPGTNVDQMRNTLSVVAALLATITFAAGFTLPGGLDSSTGDAMLAKKASFLVFLIADSYAMCTSMLVLFCLIWSMGSNRDMSYMLIDRSVFILKQALYGTMVAFMTGIYTVVHHGSLWVTIIIIIMCCFFGISMNRSILHKVLTKLLLPGNQDQTDRLRLLEEGRASTSDYDENMKLTSVMEFQI